MNIESNPNIVDIVLVIILAMAVIAGISRGLVDEALQLATLLLSIFVAGKLFYQALDVVGRYLPDPNMASLGAFLGAFVAASVVISILRDVMLRKAAWPSLGPVGRLLGGAFGLANGAIFASLMLVMLLAYPIWGLDGLIEGSPVAQSLVHQTSVVFRLLPSEFEHRGGPTAVPGQGRVVRLSTRSPIHTGGGENER
ncbi:MAG: CvpA family protein [Actinobacteria bacterium]|nr:CvpA family protein [Actinomycetota bacterium]